MRPWNVRTNLFTTVSGFADVLPMAELAPWYTSSAVDVYRLESQRFDQTGLLHACVVVLSECKECVRDLLYCCLVPNAAAPVCMLFVVCIQWQLAFARALRRS